MKNRFGVDVSYFKRELSALSRSLDNRTPDELQRYFQRLAEVAAPTAKKWHKNISIKDNDLVIIKDKKLQP